MTVQVINPNSEPIAFGQPVELQCEFTKNGLPLASGGESIEPTTVTLELLPPKNEAGVQPPVEKPSPTKAKTAVWIYSFVPKASGRWYWRFVGKEGTETLAVNENTFVIAEETV